MSKDQRREKSIMSWIQFPQIYMPKSENSVPQSGRYFGDKAFHEVIKLNSHQDGP